MEQINLENILKKELMRLYGYSDGHAQEIVGRYSCTGELSDLESALITRESMETML